MKEKITKMRDLLNVQAVDGNWNYDPYMHGMYNGMELMLSMVEDREPVFKDAPASWLSEPKNGADLFKHSEFDFGIAVRLAKEGHKVARKGWNGAGMFVYYVPEGTYPARTEVALIHFGAMVDYNPYLAIKTVNGTVSTWVPSVNDVLAEDWTVL